MRARRVDAVAGDEIGWGCVVFCETNAPPRHMPSVLAMSTFSGCAWAVVTDIFHDIWLGGWRTFNVDLEFGQ